jgi:hypothetical protein
MTAVEVSGYEFDPVYLTVANLARCGEGEYRAALQWVAAERAARAERAAANEKQVREMVKSMKEETEGRHAEQAAWSRRNLVGL